jgi:ADP-ribosylglycohydrolase
VPYEFKSREALKKNPCTEMIEFGTHGQYLGTWSDDSSLMLASMVAVLQGGSLIVDIGKNSVAWMDQGEFSPYGEVFDIGNQTRIALEKFKKGARVPKNPNNAGNGSLMRILPFGMYKTNKEWGPRIKDIINISDLTHNNFECELACGMYCYLVDRLLSGVSFKEAWKDSQMFIDKHSKWPSSFERLVRGDFENISEDEIKSSGYVIDTLEAAIWCVMNSNSYSEAVLKAINLGDDTDTVACVAGGLAGIVFDDIPYKWIQALARTQALNIIFTEFNKKCK